MRYYLLTLILLIAHWAPGQSIFKDGVLKMNLRDIGEISGSGQVTGYYFFLDMERTGNGNSNFQVSIYDENLREIHAIKINRPRSYVLVEGHFNGEVFGFMFYDPKANSIELVAYDKTLKETGGIVKPVLNTNAERIFDLIAKGDEPPQQYLVPIQGKGFIYYGLKPGYKNLYFTEFFNNEMRREWFDVCKSDENDTELASEAFQSDDYLGTVITKKSKRNSRNLETALMVHDIKDGRLLFTKPMTDHEKNIILSDVTYDNDKKAIVVFGEYYNKKDKEMRDNSQGFITLELNLEGKVVKRKLNPWGGILAKAQSTNKGEFDAEANVLIHHSLRTSDGKIFVIGEQYKKALNEASTALSLLGGVALGAAGAGAVGVSPVIKLDIYNMVVFQFNSDYAIEKIQVFEKEKSTVALPSGSAMFSPKTVSYYAKSIGGFDYLFTQKAESEDQFVSYYLNFNRKKKDHDKNLLGSIICTPEKTFMVDQMKLNRKYTDYYVFNAKYGYVMIVEYAKKEKKMEARIEKINY